MYLQHNIILQTIFLVMLVITMYCDILIAMYKVNIIKYNIS